MKSRRGSIARRYSHSSRARCRICGARRRDPVIHSNRRADGEDHADVELTPVVEDPALLARIAEADEQDVRTRRVDRRDDARLVLPDREPIGGADDAGARHRVDERAGASDHLRRAAEEIDGEIAVDLAEQAGHEIGAVRVLGEAAAGNESRGERDADAVVEQQDAVRVRCCLRAQRLAGDDEIVVHEADGERPRGTPVEKAEKGSRRRVPHRDAAEAHNARHGLFRRVGAQLAWSARNCSTAARSGIEGIAPRFVVVNAPVALAKRTTRPSIA